MNSRLVNFVSFGFSQEDLMCVARGVRGRAGAESKEGRDVSDSDHLPVRWQRSSRSARIGKSKVPLFSGH